jgi:adenylate cyclase class 2
MYEVEVKARLGNKEEVKKKLQDLGCVWSEELHQVDHVFISEELEFPPPIGTSVLRVRKQNGKFFFTLKISKTSRQDSLERELEIKDGEVMIDILKLLRYKEVPRVDKRRIKTKYQDMEVVLDTVEQLGDFIEAEKIVKYEDGEERKKIKQELFGFLATLGVTEADHVVDGKYDIMLFEKLNNR